MKSTSDCIQEDEIWLLLAELFFLDQDPEESAYIYTAEILKKNFWNKNKTKEVLIQLIAPNAGANLGFFIWPVIGEWQGFDKTDLVKKILITQKKRQLYPSWFFWISDFWCEKMLVELKMNDLLSKL